jgi:hypothetical protein
MLSAATKPCHETTGKKAAAGKPSGNVTTLQMSAPEREGLFTNNVYLTSMGARNITFCFRQMKEIR